MARQKNLGSEPSAQAKQGSPVPESKPGWTFLTNHTHVLICLSRTPDARLREVADLVGITERAVQSIVADLEEAGVLTRLKDGRRNHYEIHTKAQLRHPVEAGWTIAELLRLAGDPATKK